MQKKEGIMNNYSLCFCLIKNINSQTKDIYFCASQNEANNNVVT